MFVENNGTELKRTVWITYFLLACLFSVFLCNFLIEEIIQMLLCEFDQSYCYGTCWIGLHFVCCLNNDRAVWWCFRSIYLFKYKQFILAHLYVCTLKVSPSFNQQV